MNRNSALKLLLALVGLLFVAGIYPLIMSIRQRNPTDYSDQMMLSFYFVLGIFLLLAIRHPSANRNLIAFTGWSTLAHAAVMAVQSAQMGTKRSELPPLAIVAIVSAILIWLTPAADASSHPPLAGDSLRLN